MQLSIKIILIKNNYDGVVYMYMYARQSRHQPHSCSLHRWKLVSSVEQQLMMEASIGWLVNFNQFFSITVGENNKFCVFTATHALLRISSISHSSLKSAVNVLV